MEPFDRAQDRHGTRRDGPAMRLMRLWLWTAPLAMLALAALFGWLAVAGGGRGPLGAPGVPGPGPGGGVGGGCACTHASYGLGVVGGLGVTGLGFRWYANRKGWRERWLRS